MMEQQLVSPDAADAVIQMVEAGRAKAEDFPLLYHIRELLVDNADVNVPWSKFETETIRK